MLKKVSIRIKQHLLLRRAWDGNNKCIRLRNYLFDRFHDQQVVWNVNIIQRWFAGVPAKHPNTPTRQIHGHRTAHNSETNDTYT